MRRRLRVARMRRVARRGVGPKFLLRLRALLTRPSFAIPLHTAQPEQPRGELEIFASLTQLGCKAFLNVLRGQRRVVPTRPRGLRLAPRPGSTPANRTRRVPLT